MDYYIQTKDGQHAGPYSIDQVRAFWTSGQVTRQTPYWTEGMTGWLPISNIEHTLRASPPRALKTVPTPAQRAPKSGCRQIFDGCVIVVCLSVAGLCGLFLFSAIEGIREDTDQLERSSNTDIKKNGYEGSYVDDSSNRLEIRGKWVVLTTDWVHWPVDGNKGSVNYNSTFEGAIVNEREQPSPYKITMQLPKVFEKTYRREGGLFNATTNGTESHLASGAVLEIDIHGHATFTLTDQGEITVYRFRKE